MKINIQWKKVLYGIILIVIGIILPAVYFYGGTITMKEKNNSFRLTFT